MFRNRIAVNIAFFINGFIYGNWSSRIPRIQELYDINIKVIGFVLLASSLGAVAAMPFTGWVIIKNGSRRITLVSVILYCAVVPFIPFMPTLFVLTLLYFCMGIVTGMLDVAMNAQAVMVEQQYKRPIMTSFHAFFSVGMALGAASGALFAELKTELHTHFFIVVGICLLATIWLSQNLIHDKPSPEDHHDGPLFRLPSAALLTVGIIAFCCMLAEGSMADWSVKYMEDIGQSPKALAPIALSAFALAMTGGRIFGDRLRAMIGDPKLILFSGIIATIGLTIAILFPYPFVIIGGCFLVGIGLATVVPITYSIAGNSKDVPPGVGLAMVTTVGYAGFLVGPPVIGFISHAFTLRVGLLVVAILLCVMTVLGATYKKQH